MEDDSKTPLADDQDTELVRQLLSVKRHERPSDAYFETFLTEFQSRQRSEMLSQSARGLLVERVGTWWWGLGGKKWVYGASAATAAVALGAAFRPNSNQENATDTVSENSASAFEVKIPAPSPTDLRPTVMTSTGSRNKNGFIPVSTSSLQEL